MALMIGPLMIGRRACRSVPMLPRSFVAVRLGADGYAGVPDGLRRYTIAAGLPVTDCGSLAGQGSRWKVVRRPMDNIHHPLKLPRCEFGHNLIKGAGFADQQQRHRDRFGCFLFGCPFYPLRIERDAISIAHNRTYPGWPVQRATKSPAGSNLDKTEARILAIPRGWRNATSAACACSRAMATPSPAKSKMLNSLPLPVRSSTSGWRSVRMVSTIF